MKKGILSFLFLIAMINFVSAQMGLSDLLSSIDEATLILYAVFIISFSLLFFSLGKLFKENRAIAGIVSGAIALVITYTVNKTGFDISGFFIDLGISEDILLMIVPIIIIAGIIFMIIKFKLNSLVIIGGFFIVFGIFVYGVVLFIIVGIILIIARIVIGYLLNRNKSPPTRAGDWHA